MGENSQQKNWKIQWQTCNKIWCLRLCFMHYFIPPSPISMTCYSEDNIPNRSIFTKFLMLCNVQINPWVYGHMLKKSVCPSWWQKSSPNSLRPSTVTHEFLFQPDGTEQAIYFEMVSFALPQQYGISLRPLSFPNPPPMCSRLSRLRLQQYICSGRIKLPISRHMPLIEISIPSIQHYKMQKLQDLKWKKILQ